MDFSKETIDIAIICSIFLGAISCFFGYRIFKVILGILGFILGAIAASGIADIIFDGQQIVILIAALVGGIIGAAIFSFLYFVGIFALGAILGVIIGTLISSIIGGALQLVLQAILAIIGGIAALIFQKFMIILATAFSGSWSIVTGLYYFITGDLNFYRIFQNPKNLFLLDKYFFVALMSWFMLGIISIVIQYKITRKRLKKKD